MILAGIDEAGYGPLLGPLVVSASVFRLRQPPGDVDRAHELWSRLGACVCRKPDGQRVAVDDSKKLFNQKKGLCSLEEGLLPFLALAEAPLPRDLRSFIRAVALPGDPGSSGREDAYLEAYPWYRSRNVSVPRETYTGVIAGRSARLRAALEANGVELLGLWARPVEVDEFNRGLDETRNKAQVSFRAVAAFIRRLWDCHPHEPVEIMVDRQGGRAQYAPVLFQRVQPVSIRIETQTETVSAYALRRRGSPFPDGFRVTFATECESRSLPVALGSMLSKYVRELHMVLLNEYWREHRPDLKPTAGYSLDARRFLEDIGPLRRELGVEDRVLVRRR